MSDDKTATPEPVKLVKEGDKGTFQNKGENCNIKPSKEQQPKK